MGIIGECVDEWPEDKDYEIELKHRQLFHWETRMIIKEKKKKNTLYVFGRKNMKVKQMQRPF